MQPSTMPRRLCDTAIVVALSALAIASFWTLESHAYRDGGQGNLIGDWPANTTLPATDTRVRGVLFVHPHCPCTRLALSAVQQHLETSQLQEDWQIVFVSSSDAADDWHIGANWELAQSISGARLVVDKDGSQARAFGAITSGHCYVFDNTSRLIFSGGLTAGRGQAGVCVGQKMLQAIGNGAPVTYHTAPVYGCRLNN